jgi:adenosylhomocysteine nucleosidase
MQKHHFTRPIAIIAAVSGEVRKLKDNIIRSEEGNLGNGKYILGKFRSKDILIIQSGAGISRAKSAGSEMVNRFSPRIIISTGSCGALEKGIRKGDIVIGSEIAFKRGGISEKGGNDIDLFYTESQISNRVYSLFKKLSFPVWQGRILSIGKFIHLADTKEMLRRRYKAIAVEMESGGIAQIARDKRLPFIAVKVVSDELRGRLADYNKLADSNGNLIMKRVLPYFIVNPFELYRAIRFALDLQRSYAKLYEVQEKMLEVI